MVKLFCMSRYHACWFAIECEINWKNMVFFTWEQFLDLAWCLLCETDKFYSEIVFSLSILGNQDHCIKRSALQQQLLV